MSTQAKDTIVEMLSHDYRGVPAINVRTDDFHALSSEQVQRLLDRANDYGYRAPKNASGSRARCFFYMLQRHANRSTKP